jgi:DNA-binding transcriptional MerR regulator
LIRRIDGLRFAQEAGFTLKEIKTIFQGGGVKSTLSARWQSMARKKLLELDLLAARVVRIEDCTLSPCDVPPSKDASSGGSAC